ncbi:MAG TPA: NDP-sugar synthase [Polyangia bacterium]|nr:NDP-sugar synthase [Polyangia bacterium]
MTTSAILVALANGPSSSQPDPATGGVWRPTPLMPALERTLLAHAVSDLAELGVTRMVAIVDRPIAVPVVAALDNVEPRPVEVLPIERDPRDPLLDAISSARRLLDPGPFLLRFADGLGPGDLASQLEPVQELGESDAIVLTTRASAGKSEGDSRIAATNGAGTAGPRGDQRDFQVGMFLLGAGFPDVLTGTEGAGSSSVRGPQVMHTVLDQMRWDGGRIERRHVDGWWRYRGQQEPTLEINRFMLAGHSDWRLEGELIDSEIEGPVRCHADARIKSSIVRGPAVIGPGADLSHAYVGPFTTIGPRVKIEGAEVENSVVLEGSVISHVGVRLDSSVIGPWAHVCRDFRVPRVTRLVVGPGTTISLQ